MITTHTSKLKFSKPHSVIFHLKSISYLFCLKSHFFFSLQEILKKREEKMKLLLFLLYILISIWVCSCTLCAAQLDVNPDPLLPTEEDPLFNNSTDSKPNSPDVAEVKVVHHKYLNKKALVALIVAASVLGGIVLLLSCLLIYRLKKLKKCNTKNDIANGISFGPVLNKFSSLKVSGKKCSIAAMDYEFVMAATNNFDKSNILGEGGLYKAQSNNNFIAVVKKLYAGGNDADQEFENEVELLSKIQHQNIVSLVGYCVHGEERFLVYEMMKKGSLEGHLHDPSHRSKLTWHLRMKISMDVARGLEYLHEHCNPPVIHRDLKSSNILLDSNFNAKLSDFGLAFSGGNSNKTNIELPRTQGHVAPEYLVDGKLTDKSDVYAFGVILLELLLGRRHMERVSATEYQSIVTWAMPQITDRTKLPNIVDPTIRNTMDLKHLYQVAAIAVLCVQPEPSYRPLITDVLHSFIPLVPVDLGGSLRVTNSARLACD